MIYQTVEINDFIDAFRRFNRLDNFNIDGLKVLFEYLEEVTEDNNIELDIIALCCDFSRYSLNEYNQEYDTNYIDIDEIDNLACIINDTDFIVFNC